MLIVFVGGKDRTILLIENSEHTQPCCKVCQQKHPVATFHTIDYSIYQFMTVRPILFVVVAVAEEVTPSLVMVKVMTLMGSLSLIIGMIALIRAYHILAEHTAPLFPTKKVLFIKGIVLLVILQNVVVSSYQRTGLFQERGVNLEHTYVCLLCAVIPHFRVCVCVWPFLTDMIRLILFFCLSCISSVRVLSGYHEYTCPCCGM